MSSTRERVKKPTLHDVAREAGVSYQTVSRVINNKSDVSAVTRERILSIMKVMDYRPNRAAQMLSTQRSLTIEVIMLDLRSTGTVPGIAAAAEQHGYQLIFSSITQKELAAHLGSTRGRLIDGVVLNAPRLTLSYDKLAAMCNGIPFVQMAAEVGSRKPSIVYDQAHGSRLAIQHLIDLGHRQIAHITGPAEVGDAATRERAWRELLHESGLEPGPVGMSQLNADTGYEATETLLRSGAPFTALFAVNDWVALGAIHALVDRGLRVPQDVSVVGFDDVGPSSHFIPPLTTIRQDFNAIGMMAVDYLISLINEPNTPVYQSVLVPELIVRESTAPPASQP